MEIELLWPLVEDLVGDGPLSEEDWAFLRQSAEPLECPEAVVRALIDVRQAARAPEVKARLKSLTAFIEALGREASRKLGFILELTEYLNLPVEIVQVLIQVPRKPVLPFLGRLWRALPRGEEKAAYAQWFQEVGQGSGLSSEVWTALTDLLEASERGQTTAALRSLWRLLSVWQGEAGYASERGHLLELAREARLSESLVKSMEHFLQLRGKGQSPVTSLGEVTQGLLEKGPLTPEEQELLRLVAAESGIPESLLQALIAVEEAVREQDTRKRPVRFGAEVLEPFLRQVLSSQLETKSQEYIEKRGQRLGLSAAQVVAILELERHILEKSAKFPQHIQPLVHVLVEKGQISDEKLLYLARKAQEMGGSEKVVRSLVQIEVAAQRKAASTAYLTPPEKGTAESPVPPALSAPTPATAPPMPPEPARPAAPPRPDPPPPPPFPSTAESTSQPAPSVSTSDLKLISTLPQTFPKGGNFPALKASFSSVLAFSLRSEKDRLRKSEIFAKEGRTHWYAVMDVEGAQVLLILKGKPEQQLGDVLQITASPTGDVLALKERVPGGIRVHFNGDQSVPYEEVGSFVFSPNGRHMAYVAVKGQDQFPTLDNIPFRPYLYITELLFHPTAESDLYYIAQAEKGKWQVWDHLGQPRSEVHPAIRLLTFSPNGKYMAYSYLKNRKFQVFDGKNHGPAYDTMGDMQFTPNSAHIFYSAQKGKVVEVLWDHAPLASAEGIAQLTAAPNGEFVAYIAREKEGQSVYLHNKKLGTYDKVEKLLIPRAAKPTVIYIVEYQSRHHLFINGAPESGPYEHITAFSGRGESFAAIVRKDKDTVQVVYNGQVGAPYTNIPFLAWDETGKNLAYPARRKGSWSGVVWNDRESDHYEYPLHPTFSPDGKALLFFARRRDGWYVVLNDQPIPDSLCNDILTPPVFDEKSKSFYYLYRKDKAVREARLTIEG